MSEMTQAILHIEGMHCVSCALAIDLTLEDLPGVREARTHFARMTTAVRFDPREVALPAIVAAVAATGYTATLVAR